jgi:hypothetical protein
MFSMYPCSWACKSASHAEYFQLVVASYPALPGIQRLRMCGAVQVDLHKPWAVQANTSSSFWYIPCEDHGGAAHNWPPNTRLWGGGEAD